MERLGALAGLRAIAVSDPHFSAGRTRRVVASGPDVFLPAADCNHVKHQHSQLRRWNGKRREPFGGVTLMREGGRFARGTVLHWRDRAASRRVLLDGDSVTAIPGSQHMSFMCSYPRPIPRPEREVAWTDVASEPPQLDKVVSAASGTRSSQPARRQSWRDTRRGALASSRVV